MRDIYATLNPEYAKEVLLEADRRGVTKRERSIIAGLSLETVVKVKELHKPNLNKFRERIIGFRSEDIFTLLEFIESGSIQVGRREASEVVMSKSSGEHLYLSPNPESTVAREQAPWLFSKTSRISFKDEVRDNREYYGAMARKQAAARNLMPLVADRVGLLKELTLTIYKQPEWIDNDMLDNAAERLFNDLVGTHGSGNHKEVVAIFARFAGIPHWVVTAALKIFEDRGGILLAVDAEAIKQYAIEDPENTDDREQDLVLSLPEGSLPLSCIVGFETFSDFEDDVLDSLYERNTTP